MLEESNVGVPPRDAGELVRVHRRRYLLKMPMISVGGPIASIYIGMCAQKLVQFFKALIGV